MPLPFWKKDNHNTAPSNGNDHSNGDLKKSKEKVNYKARLEHKQYLVSLFIKIFLFHFSFHASNISLLRDPITASR